MRLNIAGKIDGLVVGVDEAGRGPLAGPVVAAAVILDPHYKIDGLTDSKKLTVKRRNEFCEIIQRQALAVGIGCADVEEIDTLNILQASLLAMKRAVTGLAIKPAHALIDGNYCPELDCTAQGVIRGDFTVPAISAASIIAKVYRDNEMVRLDQMFPVYDFAQNKGYPTAKHITALKKHGVSPAHRRSFKPVAECMQ